MNTQSPVQSIDMQLQGDQAGVSVAVHIVRGPDRIALIDSGLVWGYDQIEAGLAAAQIEKRDVDLLLNTHEHMDHIGNNARLALETGCLIGAHPRYAAWIENHLLGANQMVLRFPYAEPLFDPEPEYLAWMEREEAPVHLRLTEGTTVNLGGGVELEILELPGHSLSEIGFFERSSRTLIFGDVLMPDDVPVLYLYEDPNAMRASCRRLIRLLREREVSVVLSGHGRPSGPEEAIAWALDCLSRVDRIEREIIDAVEATPGATLAGVRDVVTERMGKHREWRALITIDGHLRDLAARGVLLREGETWSAVRERSAA